MNGRRIEASIRVAGASLNLYRSLVDGMFQGRRLESVEGLVGSSGWSVVENGHALALALAGRDSRADELCSEFALAPVLLLGRVAPDRLESEWFGPARDAARRLGRVREEGLHTMHLGMVARLRGDFAASVALHSEAVERLEGAGDEFEVVDAIIALAAACIEAGDFERAGALFVAVLERTRDDHLVAKAYLGRSQLETRSGKHAEAWSLADRSRDAAERFGCAECTGLAHDQLGHCSAALGQFARAAEEFERAARSHEGAGDFGNATRSRRDSAEARAKAGRWEEADSGWREAVAAAEREREVLQGLGRSERDGLLVEMNVLASLVVGHVNAGRYGPALEPAERLLAHARCVGDRRHEASALRFLGSVWEGLGRADEAAKAFAESVQADREVGEPAALVEDLASLGRVLSLHLERPDEAVLRLGEARDVLERIDQIDESERLRLFTIVQGNLGPALLRSRRFADALEVQRDFLEELLNAKERGHDVDEDVVLGAVDLARTWETLGNREKQAENLRLAFELARELSAGTSRIVAFNAVAVLAAGVGEPLVAVELLEAALASAREIGHARWEEVLIRNLRDVSAAAGRN